MQTFQAIVSDFDGTLAGRGGIMSSNVVAAIRSWIHSGRHFSVATGRQFTHLKAQFQLLGLTSPQIVRGASEIVDPTTGTIIWHEYIPREDIKKLVKLLIDNKIPFSVERGTSYYTLEGEPYFGIDPRLYQTVDRIPDTDMPTILMIADNLQESFMEQFVKYSIQPKFKNLHITKSYSPNGMSWSITSEKATKHLALLHLSKLIGITPDEMIAIGDGYNDYPLLSACGFKVAMANAPRELTDIADLIVPTYEEDGVIKVIEKFML